MLAPPSKMFPSEWAEKNRLLPEGSAVPGRFRFFLTPYLPEILDCAVDRRIKRIVCRKSAQVGWTDGVVNNLVGYRIDLNPSRVLILFPREKTAIDFNDEKLEPMIDASPRLSAKVNLVSRAAGNRQLFKKFPGGFLKLIASNAPGDVKSTSAPLVIVEEPDDCNQNVRGQGDSIKMAEERTKTYHDALILIGGTPTVAGFSAIDEEMKKTDRRKFFVPCHHCQHEQVLTWEFLRWDKDQDHPHPVHGRHHPETAHYVCSSCGGVWNDADRVRNIRMGKWRATAPFTGAAGFDELNELYSGFPNVSMPAIVVKYLEAWKAYQAGNTAPLITFHNQSLGRSFQYQSGGPSLADLETRAEEYEEFTVAAGGLKLVMSVDVQGNRLAIGIWAYGRDMESWLVFWGEEFGAPSDQKDGVWAALDTYLARAYEHVSGAQLFVDAVSIDSSDGQTNDAVYAWVRKHRNSRTKVMAIKGRPDGEIFSIPPAKSIDPTLSSKASRYGVKVYLVGTEKAKDLILGFTAEGGRIKRCDRAEDGTVRTGTGAGRMHWYAGVRPDFYEQLADSEVKIPNARASGRAAWTLKTGRRNEALDNAVYAEHAARSLRLHLYDNLQWAALEGALQSTKKGAPGGPSPPSVPSLPGGRFMPTSHITGRE